MTEYNLRISLREFCQRCDLSAETIVEYVEHGILEPEGEYQEAWLFTTDMVPVTRRANRLHHDLGLNWAGVALALELLSQRDRLRFENASLRQRLQRFLLED